MKYVIFFALSLPNILLAWGPTGHRVVGEVAQKHLDSSTERKISKLLDGQSLAQVANWPDAIKSDPTNYSKTFSWHYTDWKNSDAEYQYENNNGSLIKSIEDNLKIVKNTKASKSERAFALKFVVHLVGDLHMPLHVGNGMDHGGNLCKVVFHGTLTNLHQLWDEKLIEFTRLSFTEMTSFLNILPKEEMKKIQSGTIVDWARESKDIRDTLYPAEKGTTTRTLPEEKKYCLKDSALTQEELPQLGYDYSYKFMPIVERRLVEAGLRLAWILNQSL
jgi:hypothetical protein